jgi:hypothetical protein
LDEILPEGSTTISVSFLTMSVRTLGPEGLSGVNIVSASGFGPCGAPVRLSPAASKSVMSAIFAFLRETQIHPTL